MGRWQKIMVASTFYRKLEKLGETSAFVYHFLNAIMFVSCNELSVTTLSIRQAKYLLVVVAFALLCYKISSTHVVTSG